jgi:microcin C transport system substrate-binding protein
VNAKTGRCALSCCCRPAATISWVLPFQHNLQRLGVDMDIRQVDNSQYTNRRAAAITT